MYKVKEVNFGIEKTLGVFPTFEKACAVLTAILVNVHGQDSGLVRHCVEETGFYSLTDNRFMEIVQI